MTPTVILETKCWEHDWKRILESEWLRLLAERNSYPFSEKILMINNVKKPFRCIQTCGTRHPAGMDNQIYHRGRTRR